MNLRLEIYRGIPGLKLPDPLPPVPQIIARMQTVIAETESIHRKYIGADVNKLTDNQLEEAAHAKTRLSVLQLRLDQLLAAYPEHAVQASTRATSPSTEENSKTTPECDPTIDNQQTSSESDANRSELQATQSEPDPTQPAPQATQNEPPSEPIDSTPQLEPELQELALEFRNLRDHRSPLDHLTDAEHDAIIELLHDYSYVAVARILAKPSPIGLDIQTSDSALKRFVARRKRTQFHEEFYRAQKRAESANPIDDYLKTCTFMLESRLLHTTADRQSDPAKIQLLIKSIATLRRQTLAERKQTHLEKTHNS